MNYITIIGVAITAITALSTFAVWLCHLHSAAATEIWSGGFNEDAVKEFIPPKYTAEGGTLKKGPIDKIIAGLLLKNRKFHVILILGESGSGKSVLMQRVCRRLILGSVLGKYHLKMCNASELSDFKELEGKEEENKKTILFLDGLDEYHGFFVRHTSREMEKIFIELNNALKTYGRVVISARKSFYKENSIGFSRLSFRIMGSETQKSLKINLEGLAEEQISRYLRHSQRLGSEEAKRCVKLVKASGEMLTMPLFLRLLTLLSDDVKYTNSYMLYEAIINNWSSREIDKISASSYGIADEALKEIKRRWEVIFDRLTDSYISDFLSGRAFHYFSWDDIRLCPQSGSDFASNIPPAFKRSKKQDRIYIHPSFYEFNYVRNHYRKLISMNLNRKELSLNGVKRFLGECHYNRSFSNNFPKAEVTVLNQGPKELSKLRPDEAGGIRQIKIYNSKDLCDNKFQNFIMGFPHVSFLLGGFRLNSKRLRLLIKHNKLNLSNIKINSADEISWFKDFPVYSMNVSHTGIKDFGFLKDFPQLESFISVGNKMRLLTGLNECKNLKYLNISNCLANESMLWDALPPSLEKLTAANNEISSLAFVSKLNLSYLDVSDNPLDGEAEGFIKMAGHTRCIYHFGASLERKIKKEDGSQEITYYDIMKLPLYFDVVGCTSLYGLENILFDDITISFDEVPMLSLMSRPVHATCVSLWITRRHLLGHSLYVLYSRVESIKAGDMSVENIEPLFDICNTAFGNIVSCNVSKDKIEYCWEESLIGQEQGELCINEIMAVADQCLEKVLKKLDNYNEKRLSVMNLYRLLMYYKNRNLPIPGNGLSLKNVFKLYEEFKEEGRETQRILNIIEGNVKGLNMIGFLKK